MSIMNQLDTDLERAEALQNLMVARATGEGGDNGDYFELRNHFLDNPATKDLLPKFVRTNRQLDQFWAFIKYEFGGYAERRKYIWEAFTPLLDFLEGKTAVPADNSISDGLKSFDEDGVHAVWTKALERRKDDPEGAITAARTLLETVCKHILDELVIEYDSSKIEIHELYKLTAKELNLAPEQHSATVFKQILGGCSAIVNGLGTLRNKLGDAHGQGKVQVRVAPRHAELAVNLAGAMALFLISTFVAQQEASP